MAAHLHCGHLNIFHLQNKTHDLSILLKEPSPFHLFGVTESRLNPNIADSVISVDEFSVIRRDAQQPGHTGVAVYIHDSIRHITCRREDLESKSVESVWVEVKANHSAPLLVAFIYRNPSSSFQWFDDFTAMLDKAKQFSSDIVLLGDFNINMFLSNPAWECTTSLFGLKQLITTATRVSPSSSTLIDHIYTTNKARVVDTHVPEVGISDHYPVCCSWALKADKVFKKTQHTTIRYRSLKNFNRDAFLNDLSCVSFCGVYNQSDPDGALSEWYKLFLSVLDRHAPWREKRVKHAQLPAWLNADIKEAMRLRNDLKRQKDFVAYRQQRNCVKYMVREAQKQHFQRLMTDKKDIVSVWRALNAFTKPKQTATCTDITADTFNDHFLSVGESLLKNMSFEEVSLNSPPDKLVQFCESRLNPSVFFSIPTMTVYDVGTCISKMKNRRSTGHDGISSTVLKMSLPYVVDSLTYIFNLCIQQGTFPHSLKKAKVVPIPKTKDIQEPNSFRPISLLSVVSKPIEKHVHRHLQSFLETHNLIHPLQSGFRVGHSCHTAVTHLTDRWLTAINQCQMTGAAFLDLSKAFDLVNHAILIQKLSAYHLSADSLSFFASYLDQRTQYVCLNGKHSYEGTIYNGVPQGSILGPLLFSVFINDLPLHISCPDVTCSLFADDGTLDVSASDVSTITHSLQQGLDDFAKWCRDNRMVANPCKTKCMLLTTRQKHQLNPPSLNLHLDSEPIEQVREHRVLGVTVDDRLCWQAHIDRICKTVSRNLYLLSKLRHFTDEETKLLFYNAHIQPHLDYCSIVWDGASQANLKQLNSLHRRSAKLIIDARMNNISTDDKLELLNMLPLQKRFIFNKLVLVYKITKSKAPAYLSSLLNRSKTPYGTLRNDFVVPKPRIDMYKTSVAYSGACLWNSVPKIITSAPSLSSFKARLHKYLSRK